MHLDDRAIEAYLAGSVPVPALLEMDDHLSSCEACRQQMEAFLHRSGRAPGLRSLAADALDLQHLSEEELAIAASAEGQLDEEARLHLQGCEECREMLQDARHYVAPPPRVIALAPAKPRRQAHWYAWAGIAAMLAVAATAWWTLHRSPAASPALVAELRDGPGLIGIDAQGTLHGAPAGAERYDGLLAQVLQSGQLPAAASSLNPPQAEQHLRGIQNKGPGFAVIAPVSERTDNTPQFCWQALAGASSYEVHVADSSLHTVAHSGKLTDTCWTPTQAFAAGEQYSWTVTAQTPQGVVQTPIPPMAEAVFTVISSSEQAEIESARRQFPESHLLLAALYAKTGMTSAAQQEVEALRKANPGSPLARSLEEQISRRNQF